MNARPSTTRAYVGTAVTFRCIPGHVFSDATQEKVIRCGMDRQWTPTIGHCGKTIDRKVNIIKIRYLFPKLLPSQNPSPPVNRGAR